MGIALTATWALLFACTGSDPDPVVPSAAADAGGGSTDAGSLQPIAGNVLERSGFEDINCLGWTPNQASLTLDPVADSGKSSCRVCADGATSTWALYQTAPAAPVGTYTITAYVHAAPGDAGTVQKVAIRATRIDDAGMPAPGDTPLEKEQSVTIAPSDPTWQKASFDFAVQFEGESIGVAAVVPDTLEGCFLLDDFTATPKK